MEDRESYILGRGAPGTHACAARAARGQPEARCGSSRGRAPGAEWLGLCWEVAWGPRVVGPQRFAGISAAAVLGLWTRVTVTRVPEGVSHLFPAGARRAAALRVSVWTELRGQSEWTDPGAWRAPSTVRARQEPEATACLASAPPATAGRNHCALVSTSASTWF